MDTKYKFYLKQTKYQIKNFKEHHQEHMILQEHIEHMEGMVPK